LILSIFNWNISSRGAQGIRCAAASEKQCIVNGDKLFLLDSVSTDADFTNSVTVPVGFVEDALAIPPTKAKTLYLKLRDDPGTVDTLTLPMLAEAEP